MRLTAAQLRVEQRSFWRNRQAASFSFALPILLVLLFGALFHGIGNVAPGIKFTSYFVSGMIGISVLSSTFNNLSISIAFQRDLLVLKRLRGTPLGAGPLFAAKVLSSVVIVAIQVVIVLVLGRIEFGTILPRNPVAFLVAVLAAIVVFSMGGVAFTAFIPNADSGPAIVQVPFLVLQFISGVFFNFQSEPGWLKVVANVFPVRWSLEAVRAGYLGFDFVHTRTVPALRGGTTQLAPKVHGLGAITHLGSAYGVMGAWLVLFTVIAVRRFRWEPRAV